MPSSVHNREKRIALELEMATTSDIFAASGLFTILVLGILSPAMIRFVQAQVPIQKNGKVVMLTFGDGWETQYTTAKPILDKYGFKASFFVTCNFVGLPSRMSWQEILSLYHDGNDIGS